MNLIFNLLLPLIVLGVLNVFIYRNMPKLILGGPAKKAAAAAAKSCKRRQPNSSSNGLGSSIRLAARRLTKNKSDSEGKTKGRVDGKKTGEENEEIKGPSVE